ncbi:hypothetical protein [Nocardia sp. NPDC127526]|uniref:hypothetical protein n=1 Tax=Nocardia sp. NPDC127526 TaxID=3345393 RepID=UPI003625B7A4
MMKVLEQLDSDQIHEARNWIFDRTEHSGWDWSDDEVLHHVAENYDGGIDAFSRSVRSQMALTYGKQWRAGCEQFAHFYPASWRSDGKDLLLINATRSKDRHGYDDAMGIANTRVLRRQWGTVRGLSDGPYSDCDHVALDLDSPAPEDLTDVLDSLESSSCLDEDEWSAVEQEQIQEHWDDYGRDDLHKAVRDAIGAWELTEAGEALVDELALGGYLDYGHGGGYPEMIDSSACDFGEKVIPGWIAARMGTVVTLTRWRGDELVVDLRRRNVIAEAA